MRIPPSFRLVMLLASVSCAEDPVVLKPGPPAQGGSGGSGGSPLLGLGGRPLVVAGPAPVDLGASCDPSRSITSDSAALVVRDPEVLARFGLERVLRQIATTAEAEVDPLELLQRLFDIDNADSGAVFVDALHCDSLRNGLPNPDKAVDCPRAEGRLASSADLLTDDTANGFVPVAIVNRFDLLPSDFSSCGEQRIVYAKRSGRTDANDRAFLIFEAALANPQGSLASCRRVAELWAGLPAATPLARADELEQFFFLGLAGFSPVVHAGHYGLGRENCFYSGACGQVRLAQGMQEPWQFRQFRPARGDAASPGPALFFRPTTSSNALRPQLFAGTDLSSAYFRRWFPGQTDQLAATDVSRVRLRAHEEFEAGESALTGPAAPAYAAAVDNSTDAATFNASLAAAIALLAPQVCPTDDPLSPAGVLQRAAAMSCAGCHAPERTLASERKLGCGGVWPRSLGQTHIDEQGELSPALKDVFLPHRADVLQTFLRACDRAAITANLQPVPALPRVECFPAGTPITLPNGESKAIERLDAGDWVLSYEQSTQTLVPARVVRRIVRPEAHSFVRINGRLLATDNHPFYADGAWVRADSLQVGANLLLAHDADVSAGVALELAPTRISVLTASTGPVTTYNLEIDVHHSYFAGGFLVHDRP
jgi:hypothetical protein